MKARKMNSTVAAAVALTLMATTAPTANAEPRSNELNKTLGRPVAMRTLMHYADGAWLAPTSMVLKSEQDWQDWNALMVASGKAIAAEAVPSGVNWSTEAVLVVALGQSMNGWMVDLPRARRVGAHTEVDLVVGAGSGQSPCQVVAMDRKLLNDCRLNCNAPVDGLSAAVPVYGSPSAQARLAGSGAGVSETVNASWGAVKDEYR